MGDLTKDEKLAIKYVEGRAYLIRERLTFIQAHILKEEAKEGGAVAGSPRSPSPSDRSAAEGTRSGDWECSAPGSPPPAPPPAPCILMPQSVPGLPRSRNRSRRPREAPGHPPAARAPPSADGSEAPAPAILQASPPPPRRRAPPPRPSAEEPAALPPSASTVAGFSLASAPPEPVIGSAPYGPAPLPGVQLAPGVAPVTSARRRRPEAARGPRRQPPAVAGFPPPLPCGPLPEPPPRRRRSQMTGAGRRLPPSPTVGGPCRSRGGQAPAARPSAPTTSVSAWPAPWAGRKAPASARGGRASRSRSDADPSRIS